MQGLVKEIEPDLNGRTEFNAGRVFAATRREGKKAFTSVLYVREHLVRVHEKVMQFWNDDGKSELFVKGPPGSGKTCFFYLWARLLSVVHEKRVLIIQFRQSAACYIWIREKEDGALWRVDEPIESERLSEAVNKILEENKSKPFDLCVHDGVIHRLLICNNMLSKLNTAIAKGVIRKAIHVTSLAFHLTTGGHYQGVESEIAHATVDSWRREEYVTAVTCQEFMDQLQAQRTIDLFHADREWLKGSDEMDGEKTSNKPAEGVEMQSEGTVDHNTLNFNDSISKEEDTTPAEENTLDDVIEAKYYFAGGSARFFFEYELKNLKSTIDTKFEGIDEGHWKYFAQGSISSGTPTSVNTLMQQFQGKTTPLSKYALFRAYEKCKTDLVNAVKAAASSSNNPALKGWAFELEQIDFIRLSLESDPERPLSVTNNHGLSLYPRSEVSFDEKEIQKGTFEEDGTVVWCMKWNQGCFDVAFYEEKTLVTLQFTVSDDHSLKPKFIRNLRDTLLQENQVEVDTVIHVGVSGTESFEFKVSSHGTGRQKEESEEPEFVIRAYHSPPLTKKICRSACFEADFSAQPPLEEIEMWKLTRKEAKRRRGSSGMSSSD